MFYPYKNRSCVQWYRIFSLFKHWIVLVRNDVLNILFRYRNFSGCYYFDSDEFNPFQFSLAKNTNERLAKWHNQFILCCPTLKNKACMFEFDLWKDLTPNEAQSRSSFICITVDGVFKYNMRGSQPSLLRVRSQLSKYYFW